MRGSIQAPRARAVLHDPSPPPAGRGSDTVRGLSAQWRFRVPARRRARAQSAAAPAPQPRRGQWPLAQGLSLRLPSESLPRPGDSESSVHTAHQPERQQASVNTSRTPQALFTAQ